MKPISERYRSLGAMGTKRITWMIENAVKYEFGD
jgi:hypothetical protein